MTRPESVANIGPRECRRRRVGGWVAAALAVATWLTLIILGTPRPWRLLVFAPLVGAAFGWLQSRERT